jgi:hypothetical protein
VESSRSALAKRPGNERSSASKLVASVATVCLAALLLFGYGEAAGQRQMRTGRATPADAAAGSSHPAAEIGRCEMASSVNEGRTIRFLGQYANANCTSAAPDDGKFQWRAGAEAVGFSSSASGATFSMSRKPRIHCTGVSGAGEYTGTTSVIVQFTFTNCTSGAFVCNGDAQPPGVIVSSLLAGEVGLLDDAEGRMGVELSPASAAEPDFADFECPVPVRLQGSIVGQIPTIDKMSTTIRFRFRARNGVQTYPGLEGREPALLTLTTGSGEDTHTEAAALRMRVNDTSEEAVEIRAAGR